MLTGILIVSASTALTIAAVIFRWTQWKRQKPKTKLRGFGIIYDPGTEEWADLDLVCRAMRDVLTLIPGVRLDRIWIRVVPYTGLCTGKFMRTGFVGKDGKPKIYQVDGHNRASRATGTIDLVRFLPITPIHYVAVVRQLRQGDTHVQNYHASGTGPLKGAIGSALVYEMAHRVLAEVLFGVPNTRRHWKDGYKYEQEIWARIKELQN